jgi:hypothetical protein
MLKMLRIKKLWPLYPSGSGDIYSPITLLFVFTGVEKLESHFLPIALMRDKYILYNINDIKIWYFIERRFIHLWVYEEEYL